MDKGLDYDGGFATPESSSLTMDELLKKLSPSERRLIREIAFKLAYPQSDDAECQQPDLRSYVDQWALAMITQDKMASTIKLYRGHILMLLKQNPRPREEDLQQLLQSRTFAVGPSARSATTNALKSFFAYLVDAGVIDIDPARKLKAPSNPLRERDIPKAQEVARLLRAPTITTKDQALVLVFAGCGLRAAELLSCRRCDVDLEERGITVIGKRNKQRTVPMSVQVVRAVQRHLQSSPASSWLFPGKDPLKHFSYWGLNERFATLCSRAKIDPHIQPHQLRHFFASALLNSGVNIKLVSELLGHSNPSVTINIYWHLIGRSERIKAYQEHDPLRDINRELSRLATDQPSFGLKLT